MFKLSLLPATQVVDLLEQVNEIDAGKITARQLAARRLQPEKVIGVIGGCCVVGFTQLTVHGRESSRSKHQAGRISRPCSRSIEVSPGESVRILRELQELTQKEFATRAGLPLAALVEIESDRSALDIEQAKSLARALKCHPGALVFLGG